MNKQILGTGAACLGAALAGYLLAYRPADLAENEAEISQARSRSSRNTLPMPERSVEISTVLGRTPNQLATMKETLRGRYESSASGIYDWALRAEAGAILATMSLEEIGKFAREIIPAATADGSGEWSSWQQALMMDIFRQWSLKDPAGACLGMADSPFGARTEAFDAWLRRDPAAAQAWVTAGKFPPGGEALGKQLQQNFLNYQSLTDFPSARESLGKQDLETQKKTLLHWSQQMAHDPAKRDELLALLASRGDAEFTGKCYESIVREMAMKSPRAASDFLETSDLPDEQKHALSDQMLGEWAVREPLKALTAWAELKEEAAPAPLLKAMDKWTVNLPEAKQAIAWVNGLAPSPAREQFKAGLIKHMSRYERYQQAAEVGSALVDPAERIRQLKIVKRQWEEKYPFWANEWYGKLPQEDKDALGRKLE